MQGATEADQTLKYLQHAAETKHNLHTLNIISVYLSECLRSVQIIQTARCQAKNTLIISY
jgi:hypothetical protein